MPLMPKRTKHRKVQKGKIRGRAMRGNKVTDGIYGLKATEEARVTSNQIEAARIAMTRYIKRGGKVWIKIFPDKPMTKKPAETRMGSGKGNPEYWVAIVKPDRILFEMSGVTEEIAKEAFRLAAHKLPLTTKFVVKEGITDKEKEEAITQYKNAKLDVPVEETPSEGTEEANKENETGGDNDEDK